MNARDMVSPTSAAVSRRAWASAVEEVALASDESAVVDAAVFDAALESPLVCDAAGRKSMAVSPTSAAVSRRAWAGAVEEAAVASDESAVVDAAVFDCPC